MKKQKAITKKPRMKMKSVGTPTRSGNKMECEFKPKAKADDNRKDRATHMHCLWRVYSHDKGVSGGRYAYKKFGEKDNVKITKTSDTYVIGNSKDKFDPYPASGGHIIERIDFSVCLKNKKGLGPYTTTSFDVLNPGKPTIVQSLSNDIVTFTVYQPHPSTGNRPCSRTEWYMEWGNDNKRNTGFKHKTGTRSAEQFTVSFNKNDFQDIESEKSFVRLKARGQGWGGDGEWSDWCVHYLFTTRAVTNFTGFGKDNTAPFYKISAGRITTLFSPVSLSYSLGSGNLPSQRGAKWEKGGSSYAKAAKKAAKAKRKSNKSKKKAKNNKKTSKKKSTKKKKK